MSVIRIYKAVGLIWIEISWITSSHW